jgi:hypothetical protein
MEGGITSLVVNPVSKGGGKSYKGVGDIRTTWNSIKPSSKGVGVGTLFTIAYEYGYVKDKKHL